ncbi:MAG: hypothetical protein EHM13_12295 [Acidobacteria bacterium]|nr:MAG: hypothetical protein EHM13_12295 [Acidobacteriota bacterium]
MEILAALVRFGESDLLIAYIDPGTGSMIIQVVLAALVGVAVSVRHYWSAITSWFRRGRPAGSGPGETREPRD